MKSELTKQILNDGCHFQRNPKIHLQFLMDLLDIRTILNSTKKNVFFDLQNTIKKMSVAYRFFLHKDNSLANFNGTNNINQKKIKNVISEIPKPQKNPCTFDAALMSQLMVLARRRRENFGIFRMYW